MKLRLKPYRMREVHVVMGSVGEYSDHNEWPVYAFHSESRAKWFADKAEKRAHELRSEAELSADGLYGSYEWQKRNEYDPNMQSDYTGTRYYVVSVKMFGMEEWKVQGATKKLASKEN